MAEGQDLDGVQTEETPVRQDRASGSGAGKLIWVLVLLALLLAAGALMLQQQQHQAMTHRIATLGTVGEAELSALQDSLRSEIKAGTLALRDLEQRIGATETALVGVSQEVQSVTSADRTDWMLAEVEYLLRLAVQRVLMEDDTAGAERILQQADRLLAEMDAHRLYPVREALAEDLAAVRAAGSLDVEGIYLRLAAATGQIDGLPLLVPSAEAREAYRTQSERVISEEVSSVEEAALRVWDKLRGLVVVRYREDKVRPLLPPDQEYYLRHNLRMLLSQAQLALLRKSNEVYQQSLAAALEWLRSYFPDQADEVAALRAGLQELQQFDVAPRRPEAGRALEVLRSQQAERHLDTHADDDQAEG